MLNARLISRLSEAFQQDNFTGALADALTPWPGSSTTLDEWANRLPAHLDLKSQAAWRHLMALSASELSDSRLYLIAAIPGLWSQGALEAFAAVAEELRRSLETALLPYEAQVRVASLPCSTEVVRLKGVSRLRAWAAAFPYPGEASLMVPYVEKQVFARPFVWPIRIQVQCEHGRLPSWLVDVLNGGPNSSFDPLTVRTEALLEREGLDVKIYRPAPLWNACSIARLAGLREAARRLGTKLEPLQGYREGIWVSLTQAHQKVYSVRCPDERDTDIRLALEPLGVRFS